MSSEASGNTIDLQQSLADFLEQMQNIQTGQERIEAFRKMAGIIQQDLPPTPDDHIRLWRGNRAGEVGRNPSYTTSLEGIALPFLVTYEGPLSYVDIPQHLLAQCATSGASNDDGSAAEYFLPIEFVNNAQIVGLTREESERIISASQGEPQNTSTWDFV